MDGGWCQGSSLVKRKRQKACLSTMLKTLHSGIRWNNYIWLPLFLIIAQINFVKFRNRESNLPQNMFLSSDWTIIEMRVSTLLTYVYTIGIQWKYKNTWSPSIYDLSTYTAHWSLKEKWNSQINIPIFWFKCCSPPCIPHVHHSNLPMPSWKLPLTGRMKMNDTGSSVLKNGRQGASLAFWYT